MCRKERFDLVGHPECSHHWVHNAGEQCEWDRQSKFIEENPRANSNNICYMYVCTRCGGKFWSSNKAFDDIPHYRVRDSKKGRIIC